MNQDFYPIREAARRTQVPAHTLRYWEKRLQLVRPTRISGGQRRYTPQDLDLITRVRDLVAGGRMTLEGAKKALAPSRTRAAHGDIGAASRTLLKDVRTEIDGLLSDMEKFSVDL